VVQESIASAEEMRQRFAKWGRKTNELLGFNGSRLLKVAQKPNSQRTLQISRVTPLTDISVDPLRVTKRELLFFCGQLVSYYPVAE